jgi:hypothetical protein
MAVINLLKDVFFWVVFFLKTVKWQLINCQMTFQLTTAIVVHWNWKWKWKWQFPISISIINSHDELM